MSRTTNSAGWEIQEHRLPDGWRTVSPAYKSKDDALAALRNMTDGNSERRVYEALS
jgi:hypothetical protein